MRDLLDVHVGTLTPAQWDERERAQARLARERRDARPRITTEDIAWAGLGLQPRWVGDDTSSAVAAIEASGFHAQGADEWRRFRDGAALRSEVALYISTAEPPDDGPYSILGRSARIDMPYVVREFYIRGEPVRLAVKPELADGLTSTDRDLALRIRNDRPLDREWTAFEPAVYAFEGGHSFEQRRQGQFFGTWTPLLVTPDGRTVAGVWSDDGNLPSPVRHYVLPDMPSYRPILQWLVERAVPDLIPTAAARSRRYSDLQPELQTDRERQLSDELNLLTEQYETTRADLEGQLAQARSEAAPVRDGMLFGTGQALEAVVAQVLTDAGLSVEQLDDDLGTVSGDLLVERAGRRILVEVKSVGGNAPERLTEALRRHMQTWPQLRPDQLLAGAVLIVNHQHKQPPADRSTTVYQRREFVDSLEHPVLGTVELFDAWRGRDWAAIQEAIGIPPERSTRALDVEPRPASTSSERGARRWWTRRGKGA